MSTAAGGRRLGDAARIVLAIERRGRPYHYGDATSTKADKALTGWELAALLDPDVVRERKTQRAAYTNLLRYVRGLCVRLVAEDLLDEIQRQDDPRLRSMVSRSTRGPLAYLYVLPAAEAAPGDLP